MEVNGWERKEGDMEGFFLISMLLLVQNVSIKYPGVTSLQSAKLKKEREIASGATTRHQKQLNKVTKLSSWPVCVGGWSLI